MIRYLAIDPGVAECGLAWRSQASGRLVTHSGQVGTAHFRELLRHAANVDGCGFGVIEQTNGYAGSLKAAFAIAEIRGRIIESLFRQGLGPLYVNVTTWQTAMLRKREKKGDSKKRSLESAKSLGYDGENHNIADAVNLLEYATLNELGET